MTTTPEEPFAEALLAQTSWLRGLVRTLVRDTAHADDVCQATLLEAWRYRPRHDRSLRPWLADVARHLAGRLSRRERQRPDREARAARPERTPPAADVVAQVAWQQTVVAAVLRLDEPYRSTVLLRFWDGAPPRQIARRTGVPVETVRTRLKRALARLRDSLDRECDRRVWFTALLPLARGRGNTLLPTAVIQMSKPLALTTAAALGGLALTALLWLDRSGSGPASLPAGAPAGASARDATTADAGPPPAATRTAPGAPASAATPPGDLAAALCGFRGRLLGADHRPRAAAEVSVVRLALDRLLGPEAGGEPELSRRTTRTDAGGRFGLDGVWPRGLYVLLAGDDRAGHVLRLIDDTPQPGETVDLGDLVLGAVGSLRGTVVDGSGAPVAGAEVRALELPLSLRSTLPLERFDPDGALLVRVPEQPCAVLPVPGWAKALVERLPIPATRTGAEGRFELRGVDDGAPLIAVTAPGRLPLVLPRIVVHGGADRDLGTLRLRDGEPLAGRVVDTAGAPVAGAEVLAASPSALIPVDFAHRLAPTDAGGRFAAAGFAPGRVVLAVRRDRDHAWTVVAPQPIGEDLEITLPAPCELRLEVTGTAMAPLAALHLELLPGGGETVVRARGLGVVHPLPLGDRLRRAADGRHWRITDLEPGRYLLQVSSPGHARVARQVELPCEPIAVQLEPAHAVVVRVRTSEGAPVAHAKILLQSKAPGDPRRTVPAYLGQTGPDGRLRLEDAPAAFRAIAMHPAYGTVEADGTAADRRVELLLAQPGTVRGTVRIDGAPPAAGAYSVMLVATADEQRDLLLEAPVFEPVGRDGRFEHGGLQPGSYSLALLRSPALAAKPSELLEALSDLEALATVRVEVRAGAISEARLATGAEPTATETRVSGTVLVDGKPGQGLRVELSTAAGEPLARTRVRADGWYDTGLTRVGSVTLMVTTADGRPLYRRQHDVAGAEQRIDVVVDTTAVEGRFTTAGGRAIAGADIEALCVSERDGGLLGFHARTDAAGIFRLGPLPAGRYRLMARDRTHGWYAVAETGEVEPGAPRTDLLLVAKPTLALRGRVRLARAGGAAPDSVSITLTLRRERHLSANSWAVDEVASQKMEAPGAFSFEGLPAGHYRVAAVTPDGRELHCETPLELGDRDLEGLELELAPAR